MFMCLKGHTEQTWEGCVERERASGKKMTLCVRISSVYLMQPATEAEEDLPTFEHLYIRERTYKITQLERVEYVMLSY